MNLPQNESLEALVATFCEERKRAINGRKELESIWQSSRNQYKGIDSVNSGLGKLEKGETLNSSLSPIRETVDSKRSTVLVNITRPYTNAGTARVADILLPTGKMPWALRPTPISDLQTVLGVLSKYPAIMQQIPIMLPEVAAKIQDETSAKVAIEKAELIIKDWLKESDWAGVVRRQLVESGLVGTGVIKGPFPRERRVGSYTNKIFDLLPFITD